MVNRPQVTFGCTVVPWFLAALVQVALNASTSAPGMPDEADIANPPAVSDSRAEPGPSNAISPRASQYGQITGLLTDSATGQPVENVEIMLLRPDSSRTGFAAITQRNGRFWITVIPPTSYTVSIRHAQYAEQSRPKLEVVADSTISMLIVLAPIRRQE